MASVKQAYIKKYGEIEGLKKWKDLCETKSMSLKNCISRHGNEEGLKRYEEFKSKKLGQCTLKYYVDKFGPEVGEEEYLKKNSKLSVSEAALFNSGKTLEEIQNIKEVHRAKSKITEESMISKYGVDEGGERWNKRILNARSSSKRSLEYWLKHYPKEEAVEKLREYQARDKNWYLTMFGAVDGNQRYHNAKEKRFLGLAKNAGLFVSVGQKKLEEYVKGITGEAVLGHKDMYFVSLKGDDRRLLGQECIYPDIIIPSKKIIIEYFGDFWHGSPAAFQDEDKIHPVINDTISNIRSRDENKRKILEQYGFKYIVVWESEWTNTRLDVEEKLKKIIL